MENRGLSPLFRLEWDRFSEVAKMLHLTTNRHSNSRRRSRARSAPWCAVFGVA